VTGLLCAKLIEKNELNLRDKISKFFDEFDAQEKREITIENLLTHTSGFPAWKPFYLVRDGNRETEIAKKKVLSIIADEPLENPVKSKVVYSDFNFITLGFLLEKIYGTSLDEIFKREISQPLNLTQTFFNPPIDLQKKIAATEKGNEYEKQTSEGLHYEVSDYGWRTEQIWGEVHDGNCYFLNRVSGHAGLFSNAGDTFKIAQQFLAEESTLLKPATCQLFRTNFTPDLNEARSIAFQLAETKDSTAGAALSKDSFGHLGFTGTSVWVEPETERIFILLTNRTHARELPFVNINSVRRKFHELAAEELNNR
jgi:CubicO group peptidase (beta-lactamase class C family)